MCGRIFGYGAQVISMYGHMSGPHASPMRNPKVMGRQDWGLDCRLGSDDPWGRSSLWDQFKCKADDQTRKVRSMRKVRHPVLINQKLSSSPWFTKQPPNLIAVSIENDTIACAFLFNIYKCVFAQLQLERNCWPYFFLLRSSGAKILQVTNQLIVWGDMDNGHLLKKVIRETLNILFLLKEKNKLVHTLIRAWKSIGYIHLNEVSFKIIMTRVSIFFFFFFKSFNGIHS